MATRRTHIVRCPADKDNPDKLYVDVEVLDAISFTTTNGEEMVLTFDQTKVEPYIVDDTGSGNAKSPANGTRRSHMEKAGDDKKIIVEVLDTIAFSGPDGKEWILNLPSGSASEYDTGGGGGSADATRRVHKEKVSKKFEKSPKLYLTVTRTDEVAFRTVMGEELIIVLPSGDDPHGLVDRAETIMTPAGYDPADEKSVKPPINPDKNPYVVFPKKPTASSINTLDNKISQGMLWWIRKIKGTTNDIILLQLSVTKSTPLEDYELSIDIPGIGKLNILDDRMWIDDTGTKGTGGHDPIQFGKVTDEIYSKYPMWSYTPSITPNPYDSTATDVRNIIAINWGMIKSLLDLPDDAPPHFTLVSTADIQTRLVTPADTTSYSIWEPGNTVENDDPDAQDVHVYNPVSGATIIGKYKYDGARYGYFWPSFSTFAEALAWTASQPPGFTIAWVPADLTPVPTLDEYRFNVAVTGVLDGKYAPAVSIGGPNGGKNDLTINTVNFDDINIEDDIGGTGYLREQNGSHSGRSDNPTFANWTITVDVDKDFENGTVVIDPPDDGGS